MRPQRARLRLVALPAVSLGLVLVAAGCGSDGTDTTQATSTTAESDVAVSPDDRADLSTYDSVDAIDQALAGGGMTCGLEYEGLQDEEREISQCVLNGEQAILSVWVDEAPQDTFLGSLPAGPASVAFGNNWTIEVLTPANAQEIATVLDGSAR